MGENAIGSIQWSILENPPIDTKISQIYRTQTELWSILSQILLPWQRGSVGENAIGSIRWSIPKNPYRRKNLA